MENLKQKALALFFTCGVSLKLWDRVGNLERELKPYKELAKHLEELYFFTYGSKEDLKYSAFLPENIKIFPKKWKPPSLFYGFFLPFLYSKELRRVDILKTNQMKGAWAAVLVKKLYRKKLIVRCGYEWLEFAEKQKKSLWKRKFIYLAEKIVYRAGDKIILSSEKDKKFVRDRFKISSSKIEVIPNYINTTLFKPLAIPKQKNQIPSPPHPTPSRREEEASQRPACWTGREGEEVGGGGTEGEEYVPKEKNQLIFVGRLEEQKNLFNLIKAIAGLPVELLIIGKGSLKEKLEEFAKEQKAKVEFKENIPNQKLPEELNKAEVFILPSFYEGCPKTLLEAMACGLPCIATNVEGIKEIIRHKDNGYLCETSAESIRKAILEVLEDRVLQNKISQGARKTILENFSLEKILEKELGIYKSL